MRVHGGNNEGGRRLAHVRVGGLARAMRVSGKEVDEPTSP